MKLLALPALVIVAPMMLAAQAGQGLTSATFDVVSIKRNVSGETSWSLNPRPTGQFTVTNAPMAALVQAAFLVQDHQLDGLPDWTRTERYDMTARLDPAIAGRNQPAGFDPTWSLALRAALMERARLSVRRQTMQKPVYALVRARRDGSLGPSIKPAQFDCDALREKAIAAARTGGPSPYPQLAPDQIACGTRSSGGRIIYGGNTLDEFRAILSRSVGRAVLDRTNLTGRWDFVLTYAPESQVRSGEPTNAPDLFTALVEQLGLKLESTTGPVEMLIVERIERPTPD
jgi:uncharacterized protein (TIGR03435 family)